MITILSILFLIILATLTITVNYLRDDIIKFAVKNFIGKPNFLVENTTQPKQELPPILPLYTQLPLPPSIPEKTIEVLPELPTQCQNCRCKHIEILTNEIQNLKTTLQYLRNR